MASPDRIQQISLVLTGKTGIVTPATGASESERKLHLEAFRKAALEVTSVWPEPLFEPWGPSVVYVPRRHVRELQDLQSALDKAINSIVDRWWTDDAAGFPARMPIQQHEEEVLRWIAGPGKAATRSFEGHQGVYRPDYLIEDARDSAGNPVEQIRICELNGRFPYNGLTVPSNATLAYKKLGLGDDFEFAHDAEKVFETLLGMFDRTRPLHVLNVKERWSGYDIHNFVEVYRERTGQACTFILPSSLRAVPSETSPTGYLLYRAIDLTQPDTPKPRASDIIEWQSETLERVYQVSLEVKQQELATLSQDILRQLSTYCVNDLRTMFLVHDKRFLGIILEELDNLVSTQVLTQKEADILEQSIAVTILPRTERLRAFVEQCEADPTLKDKYVLKAIRGGLGLGHIFGPEIDNEEWLVKIRGLRDADGSLEQEPYSVQKRVVQVSYDMLNHRLQPEQSESVHLVGAYMTINGKQFGHAVWRLAGDLQNISMASGESTGTASVSVTRREQN